jgi:hypothetical protein
MRRSRRRTALRKKLPNVSGRTGAISGTSRGLLPKSEKTREDRDANTGRYCARCRPKPRPVKRPKRKRPVLLESRKYPRPARIDQLTGRARNTDNRARPSVLTEPKLITVDSTPSRANCQTISE